MALSRGLGFTSRFEVGAAPRAALGDNLLKGQSEVPEAFKGVYRKA